MSSCEIIEGITLHHGDCRDVMRTLPDNHFDAIITDPPYGIAFKSERWDTATPRGFHSPAHRRARGSGRSGRA
jgi:site-specific DNA-methyltransferase (adenine-specific)